MPRGLLFDALMQDLRICMRSLLRAPTLALTIVVTVGLGIGANFFLYAFINTAMVMGLIPVVGVPLPLISYGGTAMITMMLGFGLLMNVGVHRDVRIGRRGESELG